MAKVQSSPRRHVHQVKWMRKILITFHLQGLKMILSEFEVGVMKCVGVLLKYEAWKWKKWWQNLTL